MEQENLEVPVQKVGDAVSEFNKLDESGEIEPLEFDPTPYIGKASKIESIEERKGQYGFYVKVFSQPVDEGEIEIRATRIFGLRENKEGKLGWAPESALGLFLKKHNVVHYKLLVGNPEVKSMKDENNEVYRKIVGSPIIDVTIQTRTAKDGREYLTF